MRKLTWISSTFLLMLIKAAFTRNWYLEYTHVYNIPSNILPYILKYLQNDSAESKHCWREHNNTMSDHFHIFWNCPVIQSDWLDIVTEIKSILGFEIDNNFGTEPNPQDYLWRAKKQ